MDRRLMRVPGRSWIWLVVALAAPATACRAQTPETRRFDVAVDGSASGTYRMEFVAKMDGVVTVNHQANVRVKTLLITSYTYKFSGSELWKDGQLLQWDSSADDNGARFTTSARRESDGFHLRVNNKDRVVQPGFWLNTYAFQPAGQPRSQRQAIVEADSGKELQGVVEYVGAEQRNVAGQKSACAHFRIRGGVQVDLWYDAQGRLVHQDSVEDGHRTVLHLKQISR